MRYAVVMAGGGGTRLWPVTRGNHPKQLQKLIFEQPLIAITVDRLAQIYPPERILVVTAAQYADAIRQALPDLPPANVISEPVGRNTAAAIALAAFQIARDDQDGVFGVFPADHVMLRPEAFYRALEYADTLALRHRVVDIGVPPSHPETGYGYIELGDPVDQAGSLSAHAVTRFVEKPDAETARRYVAAGNYMWNSGMFVWRARAFLEALREHLPQTFGDLEAAFQQGTWEALEAAYQRIPDISVDYAIMEKVDDVVAISVDIGWRDIGDWAALYDMMEHDDHGNAFAGKHVAIDTSGSLFLSPRRLVAAVGVEDLLVIDTDDALLLIRRDRAQDVKSVLEQLRETGETDFL